MSAPSQTAKPHHRLRHWLMGFAIGLSVLILALLAFGPIFGSRVGKPVLGIVDELFAGKIEADSIHISLDGKVEAKGIRLLGPNGETVATVETLSARLSFPELAKKEVRVISPRLRGVHLALATDAKGALNIAQVFELKHPSPPSASPSKGGGGPRVSIEDIAVEVNEASFRPDGAPEPSLKVTDAQVRGRVDVDPNGKVEIAAEVPSGTFAGPVVGPVSVQGHSAIAGDRIEATATVKLGDVSLDVNGAIDVAALDGQVEIPSLSWGTETLSNAVKGFHPGAGALSLHAALERGTLRLKDLRLKPAQGPQGPLGQGELTAEGSLNLRTGEGSAHVDLEKLDAHALVADLPQSDVSATVDATVERFFAADRAATAALDLRPSTWDGEPFRFAKVRAKSRGERVEVTEAVVDGPGMAATARGTFENGRLDARGTVRADDLGRVSEAAERISGLTLPRVTGTLRGTFELSGALESLAVQGDVQAEVLGLNGLRAEKLNAHLMAPKLGRQIALHGEVAIGALDVGGEAFHDLGAAVDWSDGSVTLVASGTSLRSGSGPLAVQAHAQLAPDLGSVTLEDLMLGLSTEDWRLTSPVSIRLSDGVAFDGLALASNAQRLLLSLDQSARGLEASAEIQALDLGRLPKLIPDQPTGMVSGSARFRMANNVPAGEATLDIQALAVKGFQIPKAEVAATLSGKQLIGKLTTQVASGKIAADFKGPLPWAAGPLTGTLDVLGVAIGEAVAPVPGAPAVKGTVDLHAAVSGSWRSPRATVALTASKVSFEGPSEALAQAAAPASPAPENTPVAIGLLHADIDLQDSQTRFRLVAQGADPKEQLEVVGDAQLGGAALGPLLRAPPRLVEQLKKTHLTAELKGTGIALAEVHRWLPSLPVASGLAEFEGKVSGTAVSPRGTLDLRIGSAVIARRRLGNLVLRAAAQSGALSVTGALSPETPGDLGAVKLSGRWGLSPEQVPQAKVRNAAPLQLEVEAKALSIEGLLAQHLDRVGSLQLTAKLEGSLAAPRGQASLAISAPGLSPAEQIAGNCRWNGKEAEISLDAAQGDGGLLVLKGRLPVSLVGLGKGGLEARLTANRFNLRPFQSILRQTTPVRTLAGTLGLELNLAGTVAAPRLAGTLGIHEGVIALEPIGELQHIEVDGRLTPDSLSIDRLSANSGGGPIAGKLEGKCTAGACSLGGHLEAKRFGLYIEDQLRALLTTKIDLSGTVSRQRAKVGISLSDASLKLPVLETRSLSPTGLDGDIRIGKPRPKRAESKSTPYVVELRLMAPGPIDIQGPDVKLRAKADIAVRSANEVGLRGTAEIENGEVNAYGHNFEVRTAVLRFGDENHFSAPLNGVLSGRAAKEISGYRVGIVLSGRLSHPVTNLTSEPPLAHNAIARLLISGDTDTTPGGTSQGSGFSIIGDVLTEQVQKALGYNIPLDSLTLEPNRLEAGKHLLPRLYVGINENLNNSDPRVNGTEVHASYELIRDWSLDGRYGTAEAGSLDLLWHYSW